MANYWDGLKHFTREEFVRNGIDFSDIMSSKFMQALDALRARTWPIRISPHRLALGRTDPKYSTSQHYINNDGAPLALSVADVTPYTFYKDGRRSLNSEEIEIFIGVAKELGFTGLGVYPEWEPIPGVHLDMRPRAAGKPPATWSAVKVLVPYEGHMVRKQQYFSMLRGLSEWTRKGVDF